MESWIDERKTKRLVVLVPNCLSNSLDLAYQIHWMATRDNLSVLYLVLVDDADTMLAVSRCVATMKAVTSANRIPVESVLTGADRWMETLRAVCRLGDVIVCLAEQTVGGGGMKTEPIGDCLGRHLTFPVRTISGFYHPNQPQAKKWVHEVFAFIGFLVIIAAFTWMQIEFDQIMDGSIQKVFIGVTYCFELGVILAWFKFSYR